MPQIKLGDNHFSSEIKVYRDFGIAWWRENMQNSGDSRASNIDLVIGEEQDSPGGKFRTITVTDDGRGMTKQILEEVYFVLGETTKAGDAEGNNGGYGKGRILTCFSQKDYSIHTFSRKDETINAGQHLFTKGRGVYYDDIVALPEPMKGTKLAVDVYTRHCSNMEEKLRYYLSRSRFEARVTINGERFTDWAYCRHMARQLSFGTVYTNKQKASELLVRVNGALMFSRHTSVGQQVIIEIEQDKSKQVLQASRDGMLYTAQEELDAFIQELNVNKRSALRKQRSKSTVFNGTGTFRARRKPKITENEDSFSSTRGTFIPSTESTEYASAARVSETRTIETSGSSIQTDGEEPVRTIVPLPRAFDTGLLNEEEEINARLNLFDVILEDETTNPAIRRKIELYDPRNWDLGSTPVRGNVRGEYRRGVGYLKVLLVWKAACEAAIDVMFEHIPAAPDTIAWGVGWVFSDNAEASCKQRNDVHYLLLNPCNKEGTLNWSLSDPLSIAKLVYTAVHEVVHILVPTHDEDYANFLTDLSGPLFNMKTEVLKRLKDAKSDEAVARLFKPAYSY